MSLASYMSGSSRASDALRTGKWPGHRTMTYSSQGSYRSERTPLVPQLPELPGAVGGLTKGDLSGLGSETGRSSKRR